MWILIGVPLLSLVVLAAGITLVVQRRKKAWFLWTGIALIALYLLSLPVVLPFFLLAIVALTGGSFS